MLLYIDQINTIESNFASILAFNSLRSKFLMIAGEISLITTHVFQENKDFQNLFVTKVEQDQLNIFNSEQNQWQQLVKQIAENNNLLSFTTQNFCEIFPIQSDSEFTYQTCSNIDSLQTGFIIVIDNIFRLLILQVLGIFLNKLYRVQAMGQQQTKLYYQLITLNMQYRQNVFLQQKLWIFLRTFKPPQISMVANIFKSSFMQFMFPSQQQFIFVENIMLKCITGGIEI